MSVTEGAELLLGLGDDGRHPAGSVLGVRTPGRRAVAAGGWAVLPTAEAPGVPMTADTWLDWASVTKVAATTVLVMLLVERGELRLADPVQRHLGPVGDARGDVTLEQLLTHTAGLRPWFPLYCTTTDREAALRRARSLPLAQAPGQRRVYSDLGLVLAGHVVERTLGVRLDAAFGDLVAGPLGLSLRYGPVPPERAVASADSDAVELTMVASGRPYPVPAAASDFAGWRPSVVRGSANDGNAAHALDGVAGHAGLFGPVADLLTLGAALVDGSLVRPATLRSFAAPSAVDPTQAVGFRVATRGGPAGRGVTWLWHGGFTGTVWGLDLDHGTVVAGGSTRLHGTTGPLPSSPATARPLDGVATGDAIVDVALDTAGRLAAGTDATREAVR